MEIRVSKKQFNMIVLSEQPDSRFPMLGISDAERRKVLAGTEFEQKVTGELMSFAAAFLPVVGPYIAALQGGYYANEEWKKGNKKTSIVIGALSILPFMPQIRQAIPALSKITQKELIELGKKLSGVNKAPMSAIEIDISSGLVKNMRPIEENLMRVQDALNSTVKYKDKYVKVHGKSKFQDLFNKLVKGELTKQQYADELMVGLKDTYQSVKFGTIAGIKFSPAEEEAITKVVSQIQSGKPRDVFKLKLMVDGVEKEVSVALGEYPPSAFDMAAKNTKDLILVNLNNTRKFTTEHLLNTLSHEAAHIKDLSYKSTKMVNEYEKILRDIDVAEQLVKDMVAKYGEGSAEVFSAKKLYAKNFTKYQYHYQEMLANNSKVMQSLSRNIRTVIGQYGVPETQKMLQSMRYGLRKGIPNYIDYYMVKFMGMGNTKYVKQVRVFDKNLYKDLMKKMSKQLDYMEEQLKLYQQY